MPAPDMVRPVAAAARIEAVKPHAAKPQPESGATDFKAELRRAAKRTEPAKPEPSERKAADAPEDTKASIPTDAVAKPVEDRAADQPAEPTGEGLPETAVAEGETTEGGAIAAMMAEIASAPVPTDAAQMMVVSATPSIEPKPKQATASAVTVMAPATAASAPAATTPAAAPTAAAGPTLAPAPASGDTSDAMAEGGDRPPMLAGAEIAAADAAAPAASAESRETPAPQPTVHRDSELLKQLQPVAPHAFRESLAEDGAVDINAARVARGLQNAVNQNGGTVTLRLTPVDLGTVRIQMQLQGTSVSAQFFTENDAANATLNQQLTHLRTALEGQGLTVDRLGVQTMQPGNPSQMNSGGQQQQQTPDGAPSDGRSRGFHGGESGRQPSAGEQGMTREERRRSVFSNVLAEETI